MKGLADNLRGPADAELRRVEMFGAALDRIARPTPAQMEVARIHAVLFPVKEVEG